MLRSKFVKFLLPILKWQLNSCPNFASLFNFMRDNSSAVFSSNNIYFDQKEHIKIKFFEPFKCSDQNLSNSSCQQANSSSNFAPFFIVMTDNSSLNFKLMLFQLWIKGSDQNPNFETFKCSGEICHIPYVIFQTTSHFKVMLDKSVNNVLVEEMQFLDKCSPLNFDSLDFPQLV